MYIGFGCSFLCSQGLLLFGVFLIDQDSDRHLDVLNLIGVRYVCVSKMTACVLLAFLNTPQGRQV